jgi:hypothetical protein
VPAFPGEKKSCINITGVPGYFVEDITFDGIHVTFPGGGDVEDAHRMVPELRDHYPEYHMFGTLPAYGMYIRHAKGITLDRVSFDFMGDERRPALVCEDVEDLDLSNWSGKGTPPEGLVWLKDVRRAYIHGSRPLDEVPTFVCVEGSTSRDILLQSNDTRLAGRPYILVDGASAEAIRVE